MYSITNINNNICNGFRIFAAETKENMESNKKETLSKESLASTLENVHLIHGTFSAVDARNIILEMLRHKINFHNRQIHIIHEQTGGDTSFSEKRIDELHAASEKIKQLLSDAEGKDLMIQIDCPLSIHFQDPSKQTL
jgi:hypothetical protein